MLDASLFWRNRFHGIHLVELIGMIKFGGEKKEKINTTKNGTIYLKNNTLKELKILKDIE